MSVNVSIVNVSYKTNEYTTYYSEYTGLFSVWPERQPGFVKRKVLFTTVCPSASVDPGVFSSIHVCLPQTGPTEPSALMPVRVCVCVTELMTSRVMV